MQNLSVEKSNERPGKSRYGALPKEDMSQPRDGIHYGTNTGQLGCYGSVEDAFDSEVVNGSRLLSPIEFDQLHEGHKFEQGIHATPTQAGKKSQFETFGLQSLNIGVLGTNEHRFETF